MTNTDSNYIYNSHIFKRNKPFLWTIIISCIVSICFTRGIPRWEVNDQCRAPSICTVCDFKIKKYLTLSYKHTERQRQRQRPMLVNGDTWEWVCDRFSSVPMTSIGYCHWRCRCRWHLVWVYPYCSVNCQVRGSIHILPPCGSTNKNLIQLQLLHSWSDISCQSLNDNRSH